jgi:signal transduction histidine kinase
MGLDITSIDVHALLAGILSLTRERVGTLPLEVGFDCPTDIGTIEGDERRLRQVLFNLISNALKFTPKTGIISISAKRGDGEIGITIADTGIGIPREDQKRIFEKFERGRSRGEQSGPGLGLPLVKSFVELHGGRIELESEAGQGTAVTCWLPIIHPADSDEDSGE